MKRVVLLALITLLLLVNTAFAADPLPSWNDTPTKQAIITFVQSVTRVGSPTYVPPGERIATFDNDGTLWSEQPNYFFEAFVLDRFKAIAPQHPQWRNVPALNAVLEGDTANFSHVIDVMVHAGYTTDEFAQSVREWTATARHPKTGRLYTEMVFQPMRELIGYLQNNGFKVYIVSGGWVDFMRPWSEKAYGIPPEQVIGSSVKKKYELRAGSPVVVYLPEVDGLVDGETKVTSIDKFIGRRPIAAFGNSDGDLEMLQWTASGSGPRFALLVHHTDAQREWAYDRQSEIGRLDKALDEALIKGWTVVDMKKDWKIVYPQEKK